jgi:hypothetical protein
LRKTTSRFGCKCHKLTLIFYLIFLLLYNVGFNIMNSVFKF